MKRHALFVGVNSYDDSSIRPLRFSVPDATILSDRFGRLGFKTRLVPDPTAAQMKDAVAESVSDLRPGDVFIFFFAGHGFTAQDGSHLLFCRDDRECLLRVNGAGVRVDAIEALSDCPGVHRAFFLDSCRTDSLAAFAMRGTATRDLDFVSIPGADQTRTGSFFLLRSCDKFQPSVEIDSLQHGLFTKSLVDALDAHDESLRRCDSSFAESVGRRMDAYAANYGVSVAQRPSCLNAGPAFPLFPDSLFSPEPRSAPSGNVPPPVQEQHRRESIYPDRPVSPAPSPPPRPAPKDMARPQGPIRKPPLTVPANGVVLPTDVIDRFIYMLAQCGFADDVKRICGCGEDVLSNGEYGARIGWRVHDVAAFREYVEAVPRPSVDEIKAKVAEQYRTGIRDWFRNHRIFNEFDAVTAEMLQVICKSITRPEDRRAI